MPTEIKLMYSVNETANALSISRTSVYEEMRRGRMEYVEYKSRRYVTRRALERWIQARELESRPNRGEIRYA